MNLKRGILRSFLRYWWDDSGRALRLPALNLTSSAVGKGSVVA